jgi:hypothetical protein
MANRPNFHPLVRWAHLQTKKRLALHKASCYLYTEQLLARPLSYVRELLWERLSYAVRVTILAGRLVFPSGGVNVRAFGFQVIICRYEDVIVFNRYENTSFCRCRAFYSYNAGVFKF